MRNRINTAISHHICSFEKHVTVTVRLALERQADRLQLELHRLSLPSWLEKNKEAYISFIWKTEKLCTNRESLHFAALQMNRVSSYLHADKVRRQKSMSKASDRHKALSPTQTRLSSGSYSLVVFADFTICAFSSFIISSNFCLASRSCLSSSWSSCRSASAWSSLCLSSANWRI